MSKPTLSLCMIVKDEEKFLERCLEDVKSLVDEMIIVDTGSKDNTVEIAKGFGAKIVHYKWNNNFSEARNFSLKHATKDWILVLDADEIISKKDFKKIRKLIEDEEIDAYSLINRNYFKDRKAGGSEISSRGDDYAESKGYGGWFPSRLVILFRNHKGYEYNYVIHELVEDSIKKLGGNIKPTDIPVHHYGCDKNKDVQEGKKESYLMMVKKQLQVTPDNPMFIYEIGSVYLSDRKLDLAIENFEKTLEIIKKSDNPDEHMNTFRLTNYGLGFAYFQNRQYDKTIECFEKIKVYFKGSARFFFTLGESYSHVNKLKEAIESYRRSLALDPNDPESHNNLANLYSAINQFELAIHEFKIALKIEPNNATVHRNLGAAYLGMEKPLNALEHFKRSVELKPAFERDLGEIIKKIESVKDKLLEVNRSFSIG